MIPFAGGELIHNSYWSGMGIIPIVLAGYFFNGVYNNFAAGFHIEKKTDYLPIAIGVAAILYVILNFALIPFYGIYGSAYATLIAYFVSAVILYLYSRKVYEIKYEWNRISILIILTIIFYLLFLLFGSVNRTWADMLIRITIFILFIISLFVTKFFKKSELTFFVNLLKKRQNN